MKYLIIVLLLIPTASNAKDYFEKDIFQRLEASKKTQLKNNVMLTAKGKFISFKIHGVLALTGRAVFLTSFGDKITMTIPDDKWKSINAKPVEIQYKQSTGYNVNIDLPIELVSFQG